MSTEQKTSSKMPCCCSCTVLILENFGIESGAVLLVTTTLPVTLRVAFYTSLFASVITWAGMDEDSDTLGSRRPPTGFI